MSNRFVFLLIFTSLFLICLNPFLRPQSLQAENIEDGCTIGVAAGSATADGRPLLWKTRDGSSYNNAIVYVNYKKYNFIRVINAEDWFPHAWMGVNEKGFAILDSDVYDLDRDFSGYS